MAERWFHPEVEYVEDPSWPGSSTFHGRDRVRRTFEGYTELLSGTMSVEEATAGENGVFARVRFTGTSTGADLPFDQIWGYHCRVRDGQLAYFRAYLNVDDARRDAGVGD